ncbi:hypothetical protein [Methylobacterium brachythecii]|uniref:Immunity protein Imm1 n=1 Tax=Methylobacterium brachythecii TaxID=1176177 RepID=A0A7W6AQJ3_9HYPH|nr:hypothetical protein [Methylobacterium brachythecii]MBB3904876.1 hypothetical protein [Methylobacterium brachythecii]GLS46647.1 hypothetical protein GCM10007884_46410 [Methylobacterium brachythecii]
MPEPSSREVWLEGAGGERLCALISGGRGWLMFLRGPDDPGLSSRNPAYDAPGDALADFTLSNGQRDQYPLSWTYPVEVIERALDHFRSTGAPAPFIAWHDDAEPEA